MVEANELNEPKAAYHPPKSADELRSRYERGERNFREADLPGANFQGFNLSHSVFRNAKLVGANFDGCDLRGTNFGEATLTRASFQQADLEASTFTGAILTESTFDNAVLQNAKFDTANLTKCRMVKARAANAEFVNCVLKDATLDESNLQKCKILGSDLSSASLTGSNLQGANLTGSSVFNSDLTRADLRDVSGLKLDQTIIRRARFSPNATDFWSRLRRSYSRTRFMLNLFMFSLYMVPLVSRMLIWAGTGKLQSQLKEGLIQTQDPKLIQIAEATFGQATFNVGQLVLRIHEGPVFATLAGSIVLYQISRIFVTLRVSTLRDAQDETGETPALVDYAYLITFHRLVNVLFWIALVTASFDLYKLLTVSVWIPGARSF